MKDALPKPRRPPALLVPALCAILLAPPASARAGCGTDWVRCVEDASDLETWWQRSAAGILCAVEFVGCLVDRYL